MAEYEIQVNGKRHSVQVDGDTPLLWVLRDELGLTGTKFGCGGGFCRACTVHVDGRASFSCQLRISAVAGRSITTIEGLASDGRHPVQEAWIAEEVPQCGYCQPGQIMSAAALLAETPAPNDAQTERWMSSNLCRCGTYNRIRAAIARASKPSGQNHA